MEGAGRSPLFARRILANLEKSAFICPRRTDINHADSGVALRVAYTGDAGNDDDFVDPIRVTVHYALTCPCAATHAPLFHRKQRGTALLASCRCAYRG